MFEGGPSSASLHLGHSTNSPHLPHVSRSTESAVRGVRGHGKPAEGTPIVSRKTSAAVDGRGRGVRGGVDDGDKNGGEAGSKRRRVWAACEACRRRKTRCDVAHPCSACIASCRATYRPPTPPRRHSICPLLHTSASPFSDTVPSSPTASTAPFTRSVLGPSGRTVGGRRALSPGGEERVRALAEEMCIYVMDRKPRGPKTQRKVEKGTDGRPRLHTDKAKGKAKGDGSTFAAVGPLQTTAPSPLSGSHLEGGTFGWMSASEGTLKGNAKGLIEATRREQQKRSRCSSSDRSSSLTGTELGGKGSDGGDPLLPGSGHGPLVCSPSPLTPVAATCPSLASIYPANEATHLQASPGAGTRLSPGPAHASSSSFLLPSLSSEEGLSEALPSWAEPVMTVTASLAGTRPSTEPSGQAEQRARDDFENSQLLDVPQGIGYQSVFEQKLSHFIGPADKPFVMLAYQQFHRFDTAYKLVSRDHVFRSSFSRPSGGLTFKTPTHLRLAVLSLLSYRVLHLVHGRRADGPFGPLIRLRVPTKRHVSSLAGAMGDAPPDTETVAVSAEEVRAFARRCSQAAHGILMTALAEGAVDPMLIVTGLMLRFAWLEDGLGSHHLPRLTRWLLDIIFAWGLDQLDAPAVRGGAHEHAPFVVDPSSPASVLVCGRTATLQELELECLRRSIWYIFLSHYWIASSDNGKPALAFTDVQIRTPREDDWIHGPPSSTSNPSVASWPGGPISPTMAMTFQRAIAVWKHYSSILPLLNTALGELLEGRTSKYGELERTVEGLEEDLKRLQDSAPVLRSGVLYPPMQSLLYIMMEINAVLQSRLFMAIEKYAEISRFTFNSSIALETCASTVAGSSSSTVSPFPAAGPLLAPFDMVPPGLPSAPPTPRFRNDPKTTFRLALGRVARFPCETLAVVRNSVDLPAVATSSVDPNEAQARIQALEKASELLANLRFPNHLHFFAQYAFAGAAEEASVPGQTEEGKRAEEELWGVGDVIIEFLDELAARGSAHAHHRANAARRLRAEQRERAESQRLFFAAMTAQLDRSLSSSSTAAGAVDVPGTGVSAWESGPSSSLEEDMAAALQPLPGAGLPSEAAPSESQTASVYGAAAEPPLPWQSLPSF